MRRIAMLSGLVLVGGVLGPSTAFAAPDDGHGDDEVQWIAVQDHFAVVLPDGQTFTGDEGEPEGPEEELPPIGTRLFISEALFETEDGEEPGDEVGRTHIECTAQVVQTSFLCDIVFVVHDDSQLHGSVAVDFSTQPEGPLQFDIPVTGGSGDFFGATGVVALTDISPTHEETMTLYEVDVELAEEAGHTGS